MSFKGKVAIISGGAQGIGKAYSLALLEIGMKICIVDVSESIASQFIESLSKEYKENTVFQKCDVTSFEEFKDAFDNTIKTFGRIDAVVNNAGVYNEKNWRKTIEVNFVGVVHGMKLAFEYMGINNGGSGGYVVNTSSKAAFEPSPVCPVYSATKCAVVGLTKSYGSDYHFKKSGIKVCSIGPDAVHTPMVNAFVDNSIDKELGQKILDNLNLMKPEELGKALVKILTDGKNGALMRVQKSGMHYV